MIGDKKINGEAKNPLPFAASVACLFQSVTSALRCSGRAQPPPPRMSKRLRKEEEEAKPGAPVTLKQRQEHGSWYNHGSWLPGRSS